MAISRSKTKLAVVALCLAAMALASAGSVACQAERRHLGGRHAPPAPPHDGIGSGAGLPPPAPAPAPLPAPAGRDATASSGHDGAAGGVGVLPQPAPVAAPLPVAVDDGRAVDLPLPGTAPAFVPEQFPPMGAVTVTYRVGGGGYPGLHTQLRQLLATNRLVEGIPVMVAQTDPQPPPTWILLHLEGSTTKETATLAIRNDNIYVAGFRNAAGTWFAFPRFQRQIDGSAALPKEESYPSLIGARTNLVTLDVGKDAALGAVRFLSAYKLADDKATLGTSLATVIVMVAEAARFTPIYNTVLDAQQNHQVRLAAEDAEAVVLWGELSRAIIGFNQTEKWTQGAKFPDAGVKSAQDAIGKLRLLIRPKNFKPASANDTSSGST